MPADAEPIATKGDQDTALANVAAGLRRVIVENLPLLTANPPGATSDRERMLRGLKKSPKLKQLRTIGKNVISAIIVIAIIIGVALTGRMMSRPCHDDWFHCNNNIITLPTIIAQMTQTATAQITPTTAGFERNPYSQFSTLLVGKLVLNDPLTDNTKGYNWQQSNDLFGGCRFSEHAYHVYEQNTGYHYDCVASKTNFADFIFEVKMKVVKGDCGGILFREQGNLNSYYRFVVCQNGEAMLARCDDRTKPCTPLLPFQYYAAINRGENQTNVIAGAPTGPLIRLFANNRRIGGFLEEKNYDKLPKQGQIGLEADPAENNATEVIYSDARVWITE